MGRLVLVCRLAARDLRRRPAEGALLLLAIMAATTTLTLGLILHGVTDEPYERTRAATAGPEVVVQSDPPPVGVGAADLAGLEALASARGVTGHSGPYPVIRGTLRAHGENAAIQLVGRDTAPASIDQPKLTEGGWVRDGGVVVERSFADAFHVRIGDPITLGPAESGGRREGRSFRVVGIAVTAAMAPYPMLTWATGQRERGHQVHPGLAWLTRADARGIGSQARSVSYVLNLELADAAAAPAFVDRHSPSENAPPGIGPSDPPPPHLVSWQQLRDDNGNLVRNERRALLTVSWLLGLLALASIAVLVGGRMAGQIRRVGLLKAVGGTPGLVASVLLAQYVVLALLAAAAGLVAGRLAAPWLTRPGTGVIGSPGGVPFTISTVVIVTAVALGVAVAATFVPAVRASRISTILALADSARPPRRTAWLIDLSARLPVPLLLGLRVAGRRPRRVVLCAVSVAITVSGIVAVLAAHAQLQSPGVSDPRTDRLNQVLLLITVMLVAQAAVNAIFVTWATVLDARRSSALARALGATPRQVSAGLSAAQVLPALAGAILGIPGGLGLLAVVSPDFVTVPSLWAMLAVVPATVLVIVGLTAMPARMSARRPVAEVLQSELA
jgi:ABC-type lipoprotein release transport system permease subunit